MTIYVKVELGNFEDTWDYVYDPGYDLLTARRENTEFPVTTLAGTYDLIMKVDAKRIISTAIAIMGAAARFWQVVPNWEVPVGKPGQVYLQDDIDDGQVQHYFTNPDYTTFYTCLGEVVEPTKLTHIAFGKQIIVDITQDGMLAGVWMLDLPPEIGQKHAAKQKIEE